MDGLRHVRGGPVRTAAARLARGFTLIEMLVVIGIMGMLMAMAIAAFNGLSAVPTLRAAATELQGTITLSRQLAITGKKNVYMVFPTYVVSFENGNCPPLNADRIKPYQSYAAFTGGTWGGPSSGWHSLDYQSPWKQLPPGLVFDNRPGASPGGLNIFAPDNVQNYVGNANYAFWPGPPPLPYPAGLPNREDQAMLIFDNGGTLVADIFATHPSPPRSYDRTYPKKTDIQVFITRGFVDTNATPRPLPQYAQTNGVSVYLYSRMGFSRIKDY
jgi:prepilin-type N-terminal cleavage/methylation domain-containing protein